MVAGAGAGGVKGGRCMCVAVRCVTSRHHMCELCPQHLRAGAGSGQDVTARILTEQLQKEFPGSVFQIVNRPGAGTQIGTQAIADFAARRGRR